jgi:hypothetical protein
LFYGEKHAFISQSEFLKEDFCSFTKFMIMRYFGLIFFTFLLSGCNEPLTDKPRLAHAKPEVFLDQWHQAAADGDYEEYFGFFEDSNAVFIGTDATERWTVREFAPWAKPAFEDGMAWDFEAFNRVIYYSRDSNIVWFDEELETKNLGLLRGSGVLKNKNGEWKIAHYNLAMPIPNEMVYSVVDSIARLQKAN